MVSVLFPYADDSSVMFGFFFLHVFYVLKIISLFIVVHLIFYLLFILFYLFIERVGGREREGEKHQLVASCMCPSRGPNQQPRHVPRLGIKSATFDFAGRRPTS